jgi:hypothetical protein
MLKKKILKTIRSSKVKINNYLNNEKVETINDLEREALKQKLISVNFDDYIKNKFNTKNMMHSIIIIMICIIGILRLLFGAFVTDPKIWELIGDPFYLIGDRVFHSINLSAFVVVGIHIRIICISSKYSVFNLFVRNKDINYLTILIEFKIKC